MTQPTRLDDTAVLATLEQRVRGILDARLATLSTVVTIQLTGVIRRDPPSTGGEITGNPAVHAAILAGFLTAQVAIEATLRAGSRAAAHAGQLYTTLQLDLDERTAADLPASPVLDTLVADSARAFASARSELLAGVRAAYDSVGDGTVEQRATDRTDAVIRAVERAVRRLRVRVRAAGAVAVHRGYTDAQTATYSQRGADRPYLRVVKRWIVTSDDPCPACAALHDTEIDLDDAFDPDATDDPDFTPPAPWPDLHGPPRHPNCRCRLVLDHTEDSAAIADTVRRTSISTKVASTGGRSIEVRQRPRPARRVTAAQIRQMPTAAYNALVTFLETAISRLRALLQRNRANPGG